MASSKDIVQYIVDQCSGVGRIDAKKMMGDYCIYCDGILFGLICDNNLYIKPTDAGRAVLREEIMRSPYPGAKEHFYIEDLDDSDYLTQLIKTTLPNLPVPKPNCIISSNRFPLLSVCSNEALQKTVLFNLHLD